MGASQHKVGSPKMQLSTYQHATPPREPGITKRQLPFDPRSPTDNIARTPIIVDKTPDALLGLDPRSPTVGIERTPLSVLLSKGISAEQDVAMELETTTQAHPAGVIAPLCLPEESGDAEMTTPPKPASSPDIKCLQDIPDTDADDASLLLDHKSTAQMPPMTVEPTPMPSKPISYPKQLFPTTQLPSHAPKLAPVTRSPLGLVAMDTNSPRNIMQAKQRRQITKSMGGVRGRHATIDKENIAH